MPGDLGYEEDSASAEVLGRDGASLGRLRLELGSHLVEAVLGESEKMSPSTGPRYSAGVRLEFARSWSAAAQSRRSSSGRSVAVMGET